MNTHIIQRSVEAAKPPASGYVILFDDKIAGFGIRVTAAGAKLFVLNYRVAGEKRRTIGSWPKWTADAARDEAKNVLLPAINRKTRFGARRPCATSRGWPTLPPTTSRSTPR